jgi:hypothetical protein
MNQVHEFAERASATSGAHGFFWHFSVKDGHLVRALYAALKADADGGCRHAHSAVKPIEKFAETFGIDLTASH